MARRPSSALRFSLDTRLYPLAAVEAAAASLAGRARVSVGPARGGEVPVSLRAEDGAGPAEALRDELDNELLHETLRLRTSSAGKVLRDLVVTKALVSAQEPRNEAPSDAPIARDEPCPAPEETPLDAALERDIEALLTEIDRAEFGSADALGIAVSWEEKHGRK